MPYISPESVYSPKGRVEDVQVLYDKGPVEGSWSVAKLKWDGTDALGIRWNGDADDLGKGTPHSRGHATWFIVPDEFAEAMIATAKALDQRSDEAVLQGYRDMAADRQREAEAFEWSEAVIGDAVASR